MVRAALAFLLVLILGLGNAGAAPAPIVKDLDFSGGSERALLLSPGQPKAIVVLFPGGDGVIKLGSDGSIGAPTNFLVRSRNHWVELGYAVLLPDAPPGNGLTGHRMSKSYTSAVAALVSFAKQMVPGPVWLVGTSQGTNAVANGASHLTHGEIAGIILTSPITEPGKGNDLKETVFEANLAAINVPIFIVSHSDDSCSMTPPGDQAKLTAAFTSSPFAKAILVSGGKPAVSAPCEAEAPHGFYGVEVETIKHMVSFIAAH
jgi:hypothetical protein